VAWSQLSSFQLWLQMLCITESLRFEWFFQDITEIASLHFYDSDIQNEIFNEEVFYCLRDSETMMNPLVCCPKILLRL